jgi:arylsulfatase A-like enzyme
MLSIPVVGFHLWVKQENNTVSQRIHQSIATKTNQPNIILIIFDAMTARDMSVYGYHRQTTPFISEWTKTASLFKRLQAASNFTTPTIASLMTGKRVWTHQLYTPHGKKPVKSNIENLALVLKNNGYYNMALVANSYASVVKFDIADSFDIAPSAAVFNMPHSFIGIVDKLLYRIFADRFLLYDWIIKRDFILFRLLNKISRDVYQTVIPPEKVFNRFLTIIGDNPPEPYFAWIHLYPPHDPYLPPEPYMGMFNPSPELRTLKSQVEAEQFAKKNHLKSPHFPQEVQSTVNLLRARYNEYMRYCDRQFKDFIGQLTIKNKLKNTVIILSSDHGESFEHNYLKHGFHYLYEQVTHIPLIIKEPYQNQGRIINNLVEQIDIPATILDLAHIPIPEWMEGRSLLPLIQDKELPPKHVFSMALNANIRGHQITKGTIAVWKEDYKLIHYLDKEKSQLFNLKKDPEELNNLFDEEPEIGQRLLAVIQDNLKKANERISIGE